MTINTVIFQLGEDVVQGRKDRLDTELHNFKVALLNSLKQYAKTKFIEVFNLTDNDLFDTVKKRIRVTREAAIQIVSKSNDSNIGSKVALVIPPKNEEEKEVSVTYDELTLDQILSLNPINTNLQSLIKEIIYLEQFLPKQFTEAEIRKIIKDNNLTNIKEVMGFFKTTYNGRYDSKMLSGIAKTL